MTLRSMTNTTYTVNNYELKNKTKQKNINFYVCLPLSSVRENVVILT